MPHAFNGCERSVQFSVSWLHDVVVNPRIPMPDRMFHVATLKMRGTFCSWATAELGAAGLLASDPWHAPKSAANESAGTAGSTTRLEITSGQKQNRVHRRGPINARRTRSAG